MLSFIMYADNHYNINMALNLKILLDILMFSRGPQDLPSSMQLLRVIIIINIIIGLIKVDPSISYLVNLIFATIYVIVTLFFIKFGLEIRDNNTNTKPKYSSRYLQVCSGTLGVHAIIAIFSSLITMTTFSSDKSLLMAFLVISIYAWFVNGHIFRNSFDTTMTIGLGISLLHSMACVFVMMIFIQLFIS